MLHNGINPQETKRGKWELMRLMSCEMASRAIRIDQSFNSVKKWFFDKWRSLMCSWRETVPSCFNSFELSLYLPQGPPWSKKKSNMAISNWFIETKIGKLQKTKTKVCLPSEERMRKEQALNLPCWLFMTFQNFLCVDLLCTSLRGCCWWAQHPMHVLLFGDKTRRLHETTKHYHVTELSDKSKDKNVSLCCLVFVFFFFLPKPEQGEITTLNDNYFVPINIHLWSDLAEVKSNHRLHRINIDTKVSFDVAGRNPYEVMGCEIIDITKIHCLSLSSIALR